MLLYYEEVTIQEPSTNKIKNFFDEMAVHLLMNPGIYVLLENSLFVALSFLKA